MKVLVVAVLALAGCKSSTDNLPIGVGGGTTGGGGMGHVDAPVDTRVVDGGVAGRVCLLTDPRDLTGCAATGAGNLTVTLGTQTATTSADGSFTMMAPTGTSLVWHVTATGIETSVMPYTAGAALIPAMTTTMFVTLENDTTGFVQPGQGSIFVGVTSASAPLADATVSSNPPGSYPTFYDGSSVSTWNTTKTGAFGTAFMPGVAVGPASVLVTPMGGTGKSYTDLTIEDQALTFVLATVP